MVKQTQHIKTTDAQTKQNCDNVNTCTSNTHTHTLFGAIYPEVPFLVGGWGNVVVNLCLFRNDNKTSHLEHIRNLIGSLHQISALWAQSLGKSSR